MLDKKTFFPHVERLLERYPGATFEFEPRTPHSRVHLSYRDKRRFVTISNSTTDRRALQNRLRDIRHALTQMEN